VLEKNIERLRKSNPEFPKIALFLIDIFQRASQDQLDRQEPVTNAHAALFLRETLEENPKALEIITLAQELVKDTEAFSAFASMIDKAHGGATPREFEKSEYVDALKKVLGDVRAALEGTILSRRRRELYQRTFGNFNPKTTPHWNEFKGQLVDYDEGLKKGIFLETQVAKLLIVTATAHHEMLMRDLDPDIDQTLIWWRYITYKEIPESPETIVATIEKLLTTAELRDTLLLVLENSGINPQFLMSGTQFAPWVQEILKFLADEN
jgi:hypothetical protein